jgi:hypothetical protein
VPDTTSPEYSVGTVLSPSVPNVIVKARAWFANWDPSDIGAPSEAPVPRFSIQGTLINQDVQVDASESSSSTPGIKYRWSFQYNVWTDYSTQKTASYQYTVAGEKEIWLELIDDYGLTARISQKINIYP